MLQPYMHILATKRIVLASMSPRRKLILENIGLNVEVMPSDFDENLQKSSFDCPEEYVKETALQKALCVAQQLKNETIQPALIISADTVIAMDGEIFEKPTNNEDAFRILSLFSGRRHSVYTGVALLMPNTDFSTKSAGDIKNLFHTDQFVSHTDVEFDDLSPQVIRAYIETGEPMDKAGGYGIQAVGGTLVKAIRGDYYNVVGFPVNVFARRLSKHLQDGLV